MHLVVKFQIWPSLNIFHLSDHKIWFGNASKLVDQESNEYLKTAKNELIPDIKQSVIHFLFAVLDDITRWCHSETRPTYF